MRLIWIMPRSLTETFLLSSLTPWQNVQVYTSLSECQYINLCVCVCVCVCVCLHWWLLGSWGLWVGWCPGAGAYVWLSPCPAGGCPRWCTPPEASLHRRPQWWPLPQMEGVHKSRWHLPLCPPLPEESKKKMLGWCIKNGDSKFMK